MLGLSRLRRYSRRLERALGGFTGPLHDVNSHGADAFGEYSVNCGLAPKRPAGAKKRAEAPSFFPVRPPPQQKDRHIMADDDEPRAMPGPARARAAMARVHKRCQKYFALWKEKSDSIDKLYADLRRF